MDYNEFSGKYNQLLNNIRDHRKHLRQLEEQYKRDLDNLLNDYLSPFTVGTAVTFNCKNAIYSNLIGLKFYIVDVYMHESNIDSGPHVSVRQAKANGMPSKRCYERGFIKVECLDLWSE